MTSQTTLGGAGGAGLFSNPGGGSLFNKPTGAPLFGNNLTSGQGGGILGGAFNSTPTGGQASTTLAAGTAGGQTGLGSTLGQKTLTTPQTGGLFNNPSPLGMAGQLPQTGIVGQPLGTQGNTARPQNPATGQPQGLLQPNPASQTGQQTATTGTANLFGQTGAPSMPTGQTGAPSMPTGQTGALSMPTGQTGGVLNAPAPSLGRDFAQLQNMSIEELFKRWNEELEKQVNDFQKMANQFNKDEREMYETQQMLTNLDTILNDLKKDYSHVEEVLNLIETDQGTVRNKLDELEKELSQYVSHEDIEHSNRKSKNLICKAKDLQKEVGFIEENMTRLITDINGSEAKDDEDINNILNSYYDALEYIELDTANIQEKVEYMEKVLNQIGK